MKNEYKGFFNCTTKEELQIFKRELWTTYPEDCNALIKRSQRFVSGCYYFDNDWDMEKTQIPVYWNLEEIQWGTSPNDDMEWNYMLNRHRFLVDIAIAYLLTDDDSYRQYLEQFLQAFCKANPLTEETKRYSWRTIDVGLRLINWLKIFEIHRFLPLFSEQMSEVLVTAIENQARYIYENLSVERGQSNWQILEIAGLYGTSIAFSSFSDSQKWESESLIYLEKSLALQVEEDGMQREQSFTYHNEVLLCMLEIIQLGQREERRVPVSIIHYAKKLAKAASIFVQPNGKQPAYGDSDIEDMTGILQYAEAVLTQTADEAIEPVYFAKLSLGRGHFSVSNQFLVQASTHYFHQAGIMIHKNPRDYHLFKCGPLGGGHGHDDLLHFSLSHEGKDILIDSGRYSYVVSKNRLAFKAASAHNTTIVDHQNFHQHQDAWDSTKVATPINQRLIEKKGIQLFEGGHLGYFYLPDPVYVNRKLIHFPEGFSIISDTYICQKAHEIETFFHFDSTDLCMSEQAFSSTELGYNLISLDKEAQLEVKEQLVSSVYNEKRAIKCGIIKRCISKSAVSTYILSPKEVVKEVERIPVYSDGIKLGEDVVEAVKIHLQNGKKIVVINQHQEPDNGRRAYLVEGNYYYGRVIVLTESDQIVLY